jgi:ribosomal 50S subunit-recycling heat shock protein
VSCLFKTRSEEARVRGQGRSERRRGQTHRDIKEGDRLEITRPLGRRQQVIVRGLADKHLPKADARQLYEDVTPKPTAEEIELLRMARLAAPFTRRASLGAPDKRERRQLRRLKGKD